MPISVTSVDQLPSTEGVIRIDSCKFPMLVTLNSMLVIWPGVTPMTSGASILMSELLVMFAVIFADMLTAPVESATQITASYT